jgi:prepilin-type N-terminal cleavage/methylation domain-containing protein
MSRISKSKGLALRSSKGFTLLESMIAMAVMTIALAVIFYAYTAMMNVFSSELSDSDLSFETQKAMDRVENDLRRNRQIVSSGSSSISFWFDDLNGNSTRDAAETVTYTWTGGTIETLTRTMGVTSEIIAKYISRFNLTYNTSEEITISITARKNGTYSTLESSVNCRNL